MGTRKEENWAVNLSGFSPAPNTAYAKGRGGLLLREGPGACQLSSAPPCSHVLSQQCWHPMMLSAPLPFRPPPLPPESGNSVGRQARASL